MSRTLLRTRLFLSGRKATDMQRALKDKGFSVTISTVCRYLDGQRSRNIELLNCIDKILREWGF